MTQKILLSILTLAGMALVFSPAASNRAEIDYLLTYGQKVLIEGSHRGERRWDLACRISRKSNYLAIVQRDTANYRILPAPLGQKVERICPPDIFGEAIRWYESLQKSSY